MSHIRTMQIHVQNRFFTLSFISCILFFNIYWWKHIWIPTVLSYSWFVSKYFLGSSFHFILSKTISVSFYFFLGCENENSILWVLWTACFPLVWVLYSKALIGQNGLHREADHAWDNKSSSAINEVKVPLAVGTNLCAWFKGWDLSRINC